MDSTNKINIIFDTNIFYKSGDRGYNFSEFKLNSRFNNIIEFLESNDLYEKVTLILPKIVLTELKKQQLDKFYKELGNLRQQATKFKGIFDLNEIEEEFFYEELLEKYYEDFESYLEKSLVQIDILDFPSSDRFNNLIERAINKQAPFEGVDKKSDKGFKDALLWESILEYAEKNEGEYILYCQDIRLQEVTKEFYELFKKDILVLRNEPDLIDKVSVYFSDIISSSNFKKDILDEVTHLVLTKGYLREYIENTSYREDYTIDNIDIKEILDKREIDGISEDVYTFILEFKGEIEYSSKDGQMVNHDDIEGEIIIERKIRENTFYPVELCISNEVYDLRYVEEIINGI